MTSRDAATLVLFNARAGGLRSGAAHRLQARIASALGENASILPFGPEAAGATGLESAPEALARADAERDVVVLAGGDGTIHHALNLIARVRGPEAEWPRLAIVPAGSANDAAAAVAELTARLHDPHDLEATLAGLKRAIESGEPGTPADLGRVVADQERTLYFVNFAGLGCPADWARAAESRWLAPIKALRHELAYGLCNLWVIVRRRCVLLDDSGENGENGESGAARPRRLFAWFAANARYLGGGLDLGASVRLDSGGLAVLPVPAARRRDLVRLLKDVKAGRGPQPDATPRSRLRTGPSPSLNLDGELHDLTTAGDTTLAFDVLPGRIRWL